jgi:ketosteroid isomerase-like protein
VNRNHFVAVVPAFALVFFTLAGCAAWPPPKNSSWSNATGIEQFERLWWNSVKEKDWNEVERHLASTYVVVSPGGTFDRDSALAQIKQDEIDEFSMGNISIQPNGDATVITYTMTMRGRHNGQPFQLNGDHMMTVWQQQKRGWVQVAHAHSPASAH